MRSQAVLLRAVPIATLLVSALWSGAVAGGIAQASGLAVGAGKTQAAPAAECRGEGLYVTAWRKSGHVTRSSPEVFHRAVDEVVAWLESSGVCLVEDPVRPMIRTADELSVASLLNITRDAGAKYFLYVTVDRPVAQWLRLTVQAYDSAGQLLWQEEAGEGGGLSGKKAIPKTLEKLKKKLQPRLGQPGLPLKAAAPATK